MDDEKKYLGAIEQDTKAKEQNYAFAEIVGSANPVVWLKKEIPVGFEFDLNNKQWRRFPVRDQDGSGTCVAQTMAKLLGILAYLRWGTFVTFSAAHIYIRRLNKNFGSGEGMVSDDAYKIAQKGVTFEELMPSQKLSEAQVNAITEKDVHKKVNLSIGNYIFLPVGDIEAVASVIQTTKKGVMTWYRFHGDEWVAVPIALRESPPNHHSVAAIDFTLWDGKKSLVIDESWGNTYGMNGQRVITEDFFKTRNTHVSYPMDFKFDTDVAPTPEKKKFTTHMVFIDLDPVTQLPTVAMKPLHDIQKAEVARLQDVLKKEGLLPTNVASTGLYHNLTRKAVKAFQIKYAVAPMEELNELDGKSIGNKTLAKLNELYYE